MPKYIEESELRTIILDEIAKIKLTSGQVEDFSYRPELNCMYGNKLITDEQIETALELAVFSQARQDYEMLMNHPVNEESPVSSARLKPLFAYALKQGHFISEEITQIAFDQGGLISYLENHAEPDLLKKLRTELLNLATVPDRKMCQRCGF
ncbi:MAG: hypothetical protein KKH52_02000 [Nanoarchaeota archaeon]|nr:hypothetical protein [Nanoarchaeota archaeon]MBU1622201.1 hypothetical protein [Nanoarchaeota archaeon]MBU1974144.1 hypothetical protein [Nanoarchaeota archaeon]